MTTKPITVESVPQAGKIFRFVAYTDPIALTGYELVEEVTLEPDGTAILTATPPQGKKLCGCFHTVINGTAYSRFRIFTNDYGTAPDPNPDSLETLFTASDLIVETDFESADPIQDFIDDQDANSLLRFPQLSTSNGGIESIVTDPDDATNKVWFNSLTGGTVEGTQRVELDRQVYNRQVKEGLWSYRMRISSDIELMAGHNGWYFTNIHELWFNQSSDTDAFRISLYLGDVGSQNLSNISDFLYWRVVGENRHPANIIWEETNTIIAVPLDTWFNAEFYYKAGDASNGRIIFNIKLDGQPRQTVFDITNITDNPILGSSGVFTWDCTKWYAATEGLDYVDSQGGSVDVWWDDLKWWGRDLP